MIRWLAIAAYQCHIDGSPEDSIDIQVRYFQLPEAQDVEAALRAEPVHEYKNDLDQTVSWRLCAIPNIQGIMSTKQGSELIGFIADSQDFNSWLGKGAA